MIKIQVELQKNNLQGKVLELYKDIILFFLVTLECEIEKSTFLFQ